MKINKSLFVIAHNIRSLENVGSIFRTSDAFGVTKIFLTGYTGTPPNSKITKTALGAEETVIWEKMYSAVKVLNRLKSTYADLKIIGLENNLKFFKSTPLRDFRLIRTGVLILGNEKTGIPKNLLKLCDNIVEIPMIGKKESLNVAVAYGIAIYALTVKSERT